MLNAGNMVADVEGAVGAVEDDGGVSVFAEEVSKARTDAERNAAAPFLDIESASGDGVGEGSGGIGDEVVGLLGNVVGGFIEREAVGEIDQRVHEGEFLRKIGVRGRGDFAETDLERSRGRCDQNESGDGKNGFFENHIGGGTWAHWSV